MKADALIRWLMPKDNRFRGLLAQDTANLRASAGVFAEIARSSSLEERRALVSRLRDLEHAGDDVTRQVFEALNRTFITPLDREDIRWIASDLDDILDHVDEVAQFLTLFELAESTPGLVEFADILVALTSEIDTALGRIWDLRDPRAIQESIVRVSDLENQADALYNRVIADLFRQDCRDSIAVLKWKEIYDGLEAACDACKDFSHVLGNVVIKSA
jgi:predicted phosphate transport protein (TIGR00153 family)